MKKTNRVLTVIISALILTSALAGCGCENKSVKKATADEAAVTTTVSTTAPSPTLDEAEQAIVDNGITLNDDGKIVDKDGKEIKADKDGKITVTTEDGKKVEIDSAKVKDTESKTSVSNTDTSNKTTNSNSAKSNNSSNKTTNNNSNKTTNNAPKSNTSNNTSKSNNSTQTQKTQSATKAADSHAGKTWHEAQYKTVNHPAETQKVWVVDQDAYTYEEPVYAWRTFCNVCGADITENCTSHMKAHALAHEGGRYHDDYVQVDTKTVSVPEQGHYETKTVKAAWTEKVLVREAGWY